MKTWKIRFTVRRLMLFVAAAALTSAVWAYYFSPIHRWRRAIYDDQNGLRRWEALNQAWSGDGTIDAATALATLADAAQSESRRVRETAIAGIGRFGPTARPQAPILIQALTDPEPFLRGRAARALVLVLTPDDVRKYAAVSALRPLLDDRSRYVREQAAIALAELGRPSEALPILLTTLREPDAISSSQALWAIGRLGPQAAASALADVKALESRCASGQTPGVPKFLRVYAVQTRIRLGDRADGLAALQALTQNEDADIASEARRILELENDEASQTRSSQPIAFPRNSDLDGGSQRHVTPKSSDTHTSYQDPGR